MSEILVGQAYWLATLKYEALTQGVSAVEQQIKRLQALSKTPITFQAQLPAAGGTGGGAGGGGGGASSTASQAAEYTRLQRAQASLELQQARIARAAGDTTRAANLEAQAQARLTTELQAQTGVTTQSIAIERQLATAQQQAAQTAVQAAQQAARARSSDFGAQALESFKGGLIGIAGPAAAATAAIGALTATARSFKDGFVFKASLDATTASVKSQLEGFRNAGQTYAEATAFGRQYNITQEQTNSILQSSVGSLRSSSAGVAQLETALIRLQSKDISKPLSEAARALAELESGDVTSIKELFRVSAKDALGMRDAIVAGGDSVLVLTEYLDRTQTGMRALELRAQGVQGAFNAAEVAAEDLALAQADLAQGPGVIATQTYTGVLQILTGALTQGAKSQKFFNDVMAEAPSGGGGTFEFNRGVEFANAYTTAASAAAQASQDAATKVQFFGQAAAISAQASAADAAAKDAQQAKTALVSAETGRAADAFLALNPTMSASTAYAAAIAAGLGDVTAQVIAFRIEANKTKADLIAVNNLANQTKVNQLVTLRSASGTSSGRGGGSDAAAESGAFVSALQKQQQEQQKLLDSEIALAGAKKQTAREIELLRQKQAQYTKGTAEFNQIEAQIIGIQTAGGRKRVDAAASTALQLNQVEQNSGLQLLKTQRENLERLARAQEDFDVRRSRSVEDFNEKRRKLLTSGYKAQSAQVKALDAEFEKDQRREKEDFVRQRRRTLDDNAERTGDIDARTDLRQSQIGDRARLRGVRAAGGVDLGVAPPQLSGGAAAGGTRGPQPIAQITIQGVVNMDSAAVGTALWPVLEVRIDEELAVSLQQIGVPGAGQLGVGGAG